jgi:hypothetical protein
MVALWAAVLLTLAALPTTAMATSTQAQIDAAKSAAVEYIRGQQDPLSGEPAGYNHGSFSSDLVATALAAAGVSAADVHGVAAGSASLQDFLLGDYADFWAGPPTHAVTDYEHVTLVAYAAGLDPARIAADTNLPAAIAGRWNPGTGSFGEPSTNTTAFGILALRTAPLPAWALAPAVSHLRQNQHDDGGWGFAAATTPAAQAEPSESDMTGAAIAALCEAGAAPYEADVAAALDYLQAQLVNATGAIHYGFGDNADTTAWVVNGLNACGIDPQSAPWTTAAGKTPIDHLRSLQVPTGPEAGGFGYMDTSAADIYSTQDALRAIAGGAFTAAPPAPLDSSLPSVRPAPAVATGTPVRHLLAIELAPGNVRLCQVVAGAGAAVAQVLNEAKASSNPTRCVTSLSVAAGEVTAIDGFAANQDEAWLARLDRGPEAIAGEQPVGFGDVISLRLGKRPESRQEAGAATGPTGPAGPAGSPGASGERGARGRPGRNAHLTCRVHRDRRPGKAKAKARCSVKKSKAQRRR